MPQLSPQRVLTENAKHDSFSMYETDEPYWKRTVKGNTVDLTIGMLNDYAIPVPGTPLISPQEELQRLLKYLPSCRGRDGCRTTINLDTKQLLHHRHGGFD